LATAKLRHIAKPKKVRQAKNYLESLAPKFALPAICDCCYRSKALMYKDGGDRFQLMGSYD
jgi:hypothetical protein